MIIFKMIVVKAQAVLLVVIQPPGMNALLPVQPCQVSQAAERSDSSGPCGSPLPALLHGMGEARLSIFGGPALHLQDGEDHLHGAGRL